MQPGSGFGQTNFLLLIVPVLKLPLQLLIHHLGNWQHLTKIPVCVCVCVCSYFTVCLCFRLCVRPCVVYVSLCVHMCPYIFSCFCPRLRLFTRRLSFLLRPICLLLLACFVCCCSRRSHPPPPPSLPPLISSSSLYLPHRLPITLHTARITQATPFHLLYSSLFLSLLTIQTSSVSSATSMLTC